MSHSLAAAEEQKDVPNVSLSPKIRPLMFVPKTHMVLVHHQDGDFSVVGPLDLLPHDRVHLHNLIRQPVVVQEGPHLAAERAGLVLVQCQTQTSTWNLEKDEWTLNTVRLFSKKEK